MNKILIAILTILAIVVIGELSYIFLFNSKLPMDLGGAKVITPTPFPNHVANLDTLQTLTHLQKGVVKSIRVSAEYEGVVKNIDADGGQIKEGSVPFDYAFMVTVQGENGYNNDIFLNQSELSKTTFKNIETYKDLKAGDKINAIVTQDITKDFENNFVSAEITKL